MSDRPPRPREPRRPASRIYARLLGLLPAATRARFADGMAAMFDDALRDLTGAARVRFIVRAFAEILAMSVTERLRRVAEAVVTVVRAGPPAGSLAADLRSDLGLAARALARSPGRSLVIVATLTLGIGLNSAILSFVNGLLLRPLPYAEPSRLVQLSETAADFETIDLSLPDFALWRAEARIFDGMFAFDDTGFLVGGVDGAERIEGAVASPGFLDVLGVQPFAGRGFTSAEERPGGPEVAIVSRRLWEALWGEVDFGSEATIVLNGRTRQIVGVAPAGFHFPEVADIWVPLAFDPSTADAFDYGYDAIGRLTEGATLDDARSEGARVASLLAAAYPGKKTGIGTAVYPLRFADVPGGLAAASLLALLSVMLLLLVACTNVAMLLLARGEERRAEMATRRALGASRGRLLRLVLTECLLLAALGSAGALVVAANAGPVFEALLPDERPFWLHFGADAVVLLWTLAAGLVSAVGIGAAPALQATRRGPGTTFASERRSIGSAGRGLVVAQVTAAAFLFALSATTVRALAEMMGGDPGLDPTDVVVLDVVLPPWEYTSPEDRAEAGRRVLEQVGAVASVQAVSIVEAVPFVGSGAEVSIEAADRPGGASAVAVLDPVAGGYFPMLDIPIVEGRSPTEAEERAAAAVAVVSRALARRLWPDGSAVGRRVRHSDPGARSPTIEANRPWLTVVGVAEDVRGDGLGRPPRGRVYTPWSRSAGVGFSLLIEADRAVQPLVTDVRAAIASTDPGAGFREPATLEAGMNHSIWIERLATGLIGAFSALALLLALLGVHGSVAHSTQRRARELSVRVALGASVGSLRSTVTIEALRVVAAGVAVGLTAATVGTRLAAPFLPWAGSADPLTIGVSGLILVAAAGVAAYLPARAATRADPSEVLRGSARGAARAGR